MTMPRRKRGKRQRQKPLSWKRKGNALRLRRRRKLEGGPRRRLKPGES